MSTNKFTDEFKREVAERLGISTKSIYTWQRLFSRPAKVVQEVDAQADEIRRLKRDLARVTEEYPSWSSHVFHPFSLIAQ